MFLLKLRNWWKSVDKLDSLGILDILKILEILDSLDSLDSLDKFAWRESYLIVWGGIGSSR